MTTANQDNQDNQVKQSSAVSRTFDALLTLVNSQGPGSFLPPQEVLAKNLGVSRTVLREAMSLVLARNIVTVRPKVGTRINPVSDWLVIVPQNTATDVREVLTMFMSVFRVMGYKDQHAYVRAQALLEKFPEVTG